MGKKHLTERRWSLSKLKKLKGGENNIKRQHIPKPLNRRRERTLLFPCSEKLGHKGRFLV